MKNLKIDGFSLNKNLLTKLNQVTYDRVGFEENDYFDITVPDNAADMYIISYYKNCELVKMLISKHDSLGSVVKTGIDKIWPTN